MRTEIESSETERGNGNARRGGPFRRSAGAGPVGAALTALAVAAGALLPGAADAQDEVDVPYVPTPMPVVEQMLELTAPTAEDSVYDLGSGDGRIVITAAEKYGTSGVGVEIDSTRVATARRSAEKSGVDDLVHFIRGDLFEVDVSPATVVTLYLLSSVNLELRPKLFRELRPGTRVVSHDFSMGDWQADSVVDMPEHNSTVYYWVIPADVTGRWHLTLPTGGEADVEIRQKFQKLRATTSETGVRVEEARLSGDRVHLVLAGRGLGDRDRMELSGTVSGDRMSGRASGGGRWSASRTGDADWPLDQWRTGTGGR